MSESSWEILKQQVHDRAYGCCEYCRTSEEKSGQNMQVDHIDPHGEDILENLCLSCWNCINHKRQAILVLDPETDTRVALFNPRTQIWSEHFEWVEDATRIRGRTPTGRATAIRLKMNRPVIVIARQRWVSGGYHPPAD